MQRLLFVMVCLCLLLSGCATPVMEFSIISTEKGIDWSQIDNFTYAPSNTEGEDVAHTFLILPLGSPDIETAVDNSIKSFPGAVALTNGVIISKSFYIPFIYGQRSFTVKGRPLIDPKKKIDM